MPEKKICPNCGLADLVNGVCESCGYVEKKPRSKEVKPRRRRKS